MCVCAVCVRFRAHRRLKARSIRLVGCRDRPLREALPQARGEGGGGIVSERYAARGGPASGEAREKEKEGEWERWRAAR